MSISAISPQSVLFFGDSSTDRGERTDFLNEHIRYFSQSVLFFGESSTDRGERTDFLNERIRYFGGTLA